MVDHLVIRKEMIDRLIGDLCKISWKVGEINGLL